MFKITFLFINGHFMVCIWVKTAAVISGTMNLTISPEELMREAELFWRLIQDHF